MNGRMDVALAMINKTTFPSFGYMVSNEYEPSTTLWEKWGADNLTKDQGDASRNHVMFGAISAWFWKHLAGITPAAAGWRAVRIAPSFGELCDEVETDTVPPAGERVLSSVDATLATAAGEVRSRWELRDGPGGPSSARKAATAVLEVSVPHGAEGGAVVVVPCVGHGTVITEARSGRVVWQHGGFEPSSSDAILDGQRAEFGGVALRVAAGQFRFLRED